MPIPPKAKGTKGKAPAPPARPTGNLERTDYSGAESGQINITVPKPYKLELKRWAVDNDTTLVDIITEGIQRVTGIQAPARKNK